MLYAKTICVDDFGNQVYACRYTKVPVWPEAKVVGGFFGGTGFQDLMADSDDALRLRKEEVVAFHESEGNCNTCRLLVRVPHEKNYAGFLDGRCGRDNHVVRFHPEDPLHMKCYSSRFN